MEPLALAIVECFSGGIELRASHAHWQKDRQDLMLRVREAELLAEHDRSMPNPRPGHLAVLRRLLEIREAMMIERGVPLLAHDDPIG
jgi:hypothetical protein